MNTPKKKDGNRTKTSQHVNSKILSWFASPNVTKPNALLETKNEASTSTNNKHKALAKPHDKFKNDEVSLEFEKLVLKSTLGLGLGSEMTIVEVG